MIRTFRYRLKGKNTKALDRMAGSVNFVWNYCNQTAIEYLDKKGIWLSKIDFQILTRGCAADLAIHSLVIRAVCRKYFDNRLKSRKRRLSWRSKKSLKWIPFVGNCIKVNGDVIIHNKVQFRFWKSRPIEGEIKSGSFSQDSRGHWYVSLTCRIEKPALIRSGGAVGIDLGLKTIATLSDGVKLSRENLTNKYADRLAMSQRARKPSLTRTIHAKIRNTRKDWNHKQTTKLINQYDRIVVGNVSPSKLKKTRMAKSVSDASWYDFKSMLAYKAIALGVDYREVNESYSTVTCSGCLARSGPSGLSALSVREWACKICGVVHDRDVNAAQNILRFGHESPIKGVFI